MKTTNSQAEVKPFKVGETLTDNADGNPEPSSSNSLEQACVETRQKVCIKCGNEITKKRKGLKYCSAKCRTNYLSLKSRVKAGLIKNPGVGSGNNQFGENNHQWTGKSGRAGCMRAMKALPNICNRCESVENLLAHHIDEDRTNNDLFNFEILCKKCHQNHHCKKDNGGKYIKG